MGLWNYNTPVPYLRTLLSRWFRGYALADPLGRRAEDLAARYVRRQLHMRVLARNVRCPGGELDIIALTGTTLAFIEVRALTDTSLIRPEETLGPDKRFFLMRSARWFIRTRRLQQFQPRGDLIAIVWPRGGRPEVRHYPNAWALHKPHHVRSHKT
ncbi:MAG: YraN family protein [Phycisphaerae bacterium]